MLFLIAFVQRTRRAVAAVQTPKLMISATCVVLFCAFAGAVVEARGWQERRSLILTDPDTVLSHPALAAYAAAAGRKLFLTRCAQCHGAEGKGDSTLGVPDLADGVYLYGNGQVSEIEDIVRHGIRAGDRRGRNFAFMPAYATVRPYAAEPIPPLTPREVGDVVQFLLSFTGRSTNAEATSLGHALFLGKGGCYDCHGGDARGDPAIGAPNLTGRAWLYGDGSAGALAVSIERGRKGYSPAYAQVLTFAEIREVAVYVAALSHFAPLHTAGQ